jgi:hypothetical protein
MDALLSSRADAFLTIVYIYIRNGIKRKNIEKDGLNQLDVI